MDADNIAALIRGLRTTPSRRAVSTALLALVASSALASLVGPEASEAKGNKGKGKGKGKKKHKKKKDPKDLLPKCATGQVQCDDLQCCATNLCTSCGCCPATQPACCGNATTANRLCYSTGAEECCPSAQANIVGACPKGTFCANPIGGVPWCCPSGSEACAVGCCPQGTFCCSGVCCDNIACKPAPEGNCFAEPLGTPARIA